MHAMKQMQRAFEDVELARDNGSFMNRGLLYLKLSCHMHYAKNRFIAYMVEGVLKNKGLPGCGFIWVRG